ncbi:MAG TPA: cyclic nucleotide-binding domain-containing protein [Candidatus Binatia bacterium]|nr:cyclic nucleotide-binding domain-containing protein [Candidatus Binatia bacterium]
MKTIAELIAEHAFFEGLAESELTFLAGCAKNVHFDAGTRILAEGDEANTFYVIRTGKVALGYFQPERGNVVIETLRGGDVLGWSWLFEPYRWHFDADAAEPVSAMAFDGACLRSKCETDPRLCYQMTQRFAKVMMERLQATRLRLLDIYGPPGSR